MFLFFGLDGCSSIFSYTFHGMDRNHDGTIDFQEFLISMTTCFRGNLEDQLSDIFDVSVIECIRRVSSRHPPSSAFSDVICPVMDSSISKN